MSTFRVVASFLSGAVLVTAPLTGCSVVGPEGDPQSNQYEIALREASSDFERRVLDDLSISRGEYEEAVALYVDCINASGWTMISIPQDGLYVYQVEGRAEGAEWDRANVGCVEGTTGLIEPLYVDSLAENVGESALEQVASCLESRGVIDRPISEDELLRYLPNANGEPATDVPPWDKDDAAANACLLGR